MRAADTYGVSEGLPGYLDVTGAVRMGAAPDAAVGPGAAVSIPTGGVLPAGADAVIMVEYTQEAMPGTIEVVRPVAPGDGVVRADEDAVAGAEIVPAGRPLRAQDLGMLAAAGVTSLAVHARPRVTVFSTGDEVVPPAVAELRPGQVRDATAVALAALVTEAGGEPAQGGIIPDDAAALAVRAGGRAGRQRPDRGLGRLVGRGPRRDRHGGQAASDRRASGVMAWRSGPASPRCWPSAPECPSSGCPATRVPRWWCSG